MVPFLHAYYVTAPNDRPDYRTVKAFLWGDTCNCDGDGNARNPASRTWTQLMFEPRDRQGERFDVVEYTIEPLTLKVHSSNPALAARVAYILAFATNGTIARTPNGSYELPQSVIAEMGDFDLDAAFARFYDSPFTRSTLDNPYPNLERSE